MIKPLFEIFEINETYILYDPITNKFRTIPFCAYNFLQEVKLCANNEEIPAALIRKHIDGYSYINGLMSNAKFLVYNKFCEPKYPYSEEQVEYMLNHRQKQIILELTKDCNFRCKYCILSDIYNKDSRYEMGHMETSTIIRSIDFFIENSSDSEMLTISFYGGEPFMCFEQIRQCVEYTLLKTTGKKVSFTTTTNGSLLNKSIVDFIVKYDFNVMISLDGPKEIHDMNRVFNNGKGTYDIIEENLQYIKEFYPDFFKKNIIFHSVVAFPEFTNEVIGHFNDTYANDFNYSYVEPGYNREKFEMLYKDGIDNYEMKYSKKNFMKEMQESIRKNHMLSNNITNLYDKDIAEIFQMRPRNSNNFFWPAGTCDIGSRRMFVDVNGNIFPCEKVSYDDETNCIGTIFDGFDISKVMNIIKDYEKTATPCMECWCANLCKRCWKQKSFESEFCENMKKTVYKQIKNSLELLMESPTIVKQYDKVELK